MKRHAELALYGLLVLVGTVMLLGVGSHSALAQEENTTTHTFESQLTDSNGDPIPHVEVKFEQYSDAYIEFGEVHLGQRYSTHGTWTATTDANGNYSIEIPYEVHDDGSYTNTKGVIRIPDGENPYSEVDMGVFEAGSVTNLNYLSQDNLDVTAADYDGTSSDPYTYPDDSDDSDSTDDGDTNTVLEKPTVNIEVQSLEIQEGQSAEFKAVLESDNVTAEDVNFAWFVNEESAGGDNQTYTETFAEAGEYQIEVAVTPADNHTWADGTTTEVVGEYSILDQYWSNGSIQFSDVTISSYIDGSPVPATVEVTSITKTGETVTIRVPEGDRTINAEYKMDGDLYTGTESVDATGESLTVDIDLTEMEYYLPPTESSGDGCAGILECATGVLTGDIPLTGEGSVFDAMTSGGQEGGIPSAGVMITVLALGAVIASALFKFLWSLISPGDFHFPLRLILGDDDE
ncbi:hypothetical protein JMJ58_03800 [Haloterrigena salifodinae]|uniref:PKD domain-containing protein n=1 Tax=Haloterrigena salifodinae TaxID=2675099 RepID=A0A8T8E3A4_9EURY|nr:hypothetical protein [Haloterrigena salifodinae]QRV16033.1 hypothetical protein JMJ58_03800 [Haloterrigena salifodinae]